ncbi:MAG: hypothetical protein M1826_001507 [Phylliscum demangeonii]|nr:MAG: hypothetical protein M1826_001507 [Phylliscum demangeonii]
MAAPVPVSLQDAAPEGKSLPAGIAIGSSAASVLVGGGGALFHQLDKKRTSRDWDHYVSQIHTHYNQELDETMGWAHEKHQELLDHIRLLQGQTIEADTFRRSVAVDNVLLDNRGLIDCIRPFLAERHAIQKQYLVKSDVWNQAVDHCDPAHRYPLLRDEAAYLYIPSLGSGGSASRALPRPPAHTAPSPFALLAHAEATAGRSLHGLLSTAHRSLVKPVANARVAAGLMMSKAKPLEQGMVGMLQRAER